MAEDRVLFIDNEYCLTLEQLRGYFARDLKPETRLYEELLTLQCDGMLQQWLEQGTTDDEQELARQLKELSGKQTNNELMIELSRIFTGHSGKIDKPHPSNFLDLLAVECRANGQQVSLWSLGNHQYTGGIDVSNEKSPYPEVQVSLSFKVKKKDNEQFNIQLMTPKGQMIKSDSLSLRTHKVGSTVIVDFAPVNLYPGMMVLSITVDGEQWAALQLMVKGLFFAVNGVSFNMIYVEGGMFIMGATAEQGGDAYNDEKPTHEVTLSSYYIGETPVTQELWEAVMGNNPSYFTGPKRPVENVSWDDCQTFIDKLNALLKDQLDDWRFHLPTEAQWEYVARGGKKSQRYKYVGGNDIDKVAWYDGNASGQTHNVKQKAPNELLIYDMSGNVREWCQDRFGSYNSTPQTEPTGPTSGSNRVSRGGGWGSNARCCRVSLRSCSTPTSVSSYLGLRLVLSSTINKRRLFAENLRNYMHCENLLYNLMRLRNQVK